MANQPDGLVTFLFIDVAGDHMDSTQLQHGMLDHYQAILRQAVKGCGGVIFRISGDSVYAAFSAAPAALAAALAVYWTMHTKAWEDVAPPRMRMILHSGPANRHSSVYVGPALNHAASLLAACRNDQILISHITADLVGEHLPPRTELRNLGTHRLKDLTRTEQIFQLIPPNQPAELSSFPLIDTLSANLPVLATPLIGRDREVAEIRDILRQPDVRILTLLGSSGTGKTRLSLQVSIELISEFDDGVYFVPLAPVGTPILVASTIAHALNVQEAADQPLLATLQGYLRERNLLLILDNFEQLLAAAPLLESLLNAAPRLKVMVTTQARLGIAHEYVFPVPPLALPDPLRLPALDQLANFASIALFLERAQVVRPDFALSNENAVTLAELCVALGGLPLSIELAAAHTDQFTPAEMLDQITKRLMAIRQRFRAEPTHKQVLYEVLDWSYRLLGADEQRLLARLGIFEGGCTLDAVDAVCNPNADLDIDVLSATALLIDKNLLVQEEWLNDEPRYMMLDMIHQYALARLADDHETDLLRQSHALYNLRMAEMGETELTGANQEVWLKRLEGEIHNLRAALEWSRARDDYESLARLSGSLWRFWLVYGYLSEGRRWLEESLANNGQPPEVRAKALNGAGVLAFMQGDYMQAKQYAEANLHIRRDLGDKRGMAGILCNLGSMMIEHEEDAQGRAFLIESLALYRELGDDWGAAIALNNLGRSIENEGDLAQAEALYTEGLAKFRALADKGNTANLLDSLGWVVLAQGNYERAQPLFEEGLSLARDLGYKEGIAGCLLAFAYIAAAQTQPLRAARFVGVFDGIFVSAGMLLPPSEQARRARVVDAIHKQIDEAAFASARDEGCAMAVEHAIDLVLPASSS